MVQKDVQKDTLPHEPKRTDEPELTPQDDFQPQTLEERVLVELSDAVSSKVFRVRREERE